MLNGKSASVPSMIRTGIQWVENQTLKRSRQYRRPCKSTTMFEFVFVLWNLELVGFK